MGRPTKLDDLVAERIAKAVAVGLPWALAAQAAGVGASTLREWKQRGRDGEEPFAAFLARLERAEGEAAAHAMACVLSAAADPKHWTAAAWMLERRHPEHFSLKRDIVPETEAAKAVDDATMDSVIAAWQSRRTT